MTYDIVINNKIVGSVEVESIEEFENTPPYCIDLQMLGSNVRHEFERCGSVIVPDVEE